MEPTTSDITSNVDKKRRNDDDDVNKLTTEEIGKQPCQYGSKCYRKNPQHHQEYSHPEGIIE